MRRIMLLLSEFFIAKRLHIGILAFVKPIYFMRCFGINSYHPLTPFISFLIVWAAYLENITTDTEEDKLGQVPHGMLPSIEPRLPTIEKLYPLIYLIALGVSLLISIKVCLFTAATIIIFSGYVHRWIPAKGKKRKRLKEIFIVKNLVPAFGWLFISAVIPFVSSGSLFIPEYVLFMLILILMSFREEIKFDIPDTEGDQRAGIKTIPNMLGEEHTKFILGGIQYILGLLFLILLILLRQNNRVPQFDSLLLNMFPIVVVFLYDHNFVNLLFRTKRKEFCNIGIIWVDILKGLYLSIPLPWNIIIYLSSRIAGSLVTQTTDLVKHFLNNLNDSAQRLYSPAG